MEKISYKSLINGNIPPWVMRFIKGVGKTINSYEMIKENDDVLIATSGGKDSLSLSLSLSLRRKWLPVSYNLKAVLINMIEHPIEEDKIDKIKEYYDALDIDLIVLNEHQFPPYFNEGDKFDCYLCSRNRRRILFKWADERNIHTIAMGHHLDDITETTLMNLCFRGKFSSMLPSQDFFDGKLKIVRPLAETRENITERLSETYDLPVVKPVCPYDKTNVRAKLKPIVKDLSHIDKLTREHIYKALGYKI